MYIITAYQNKSHKEGKMVIETLSVALVLSLIYCFFTNPKTAEFAKNLMILIGVILVFMVCMGIIPFAIWLILYFGFEIPNPKAIWISIGIFLVISFMKTSITIRR